MDEIFTNSLNYLSKQSLNEILKIKNYKDFECTKVVRDFESLFPLGFFIHMVSTFNSDQKELFKNILSESVNFLLEESGNYFSFNYFPRKHYKNNQENSNFAVPDDLDDTSLILSSLTKLGVEVSESFFFKIIELESKQGGPYKTWFYDKKGWDDIDPIVNANLVYFLGLNQIRVKNTEKFLLKCLQTNNIRSLYYPSELFFYFYISKYLSVVKNRRLREATIINLSNINFNKLVSLDKILYLLSSIYLDLEVKQEQLDFLNLIKNKDGGFISLPIYYDYSDSGSKTFAGSEIFTTILVCELLSKYFKPQESLQKQELTDKNIQTVISIINKETSNSGLPLKNRVIFQKVEESKAIKLVFLTAYALKKNLDKVEKNKLTLLALATYYGWVGYTIIDHIIDNQVENKFVNISSYYLRKHIQYIEQLSTYNRSIKKDYEKYLIKIEKNYIKEYENNKKFKKNHLLINYSISNITNRMGPFLYLISLVPEFIGFKNSEVETNIENFFKYVVLIDQLNDDAHDWKEDLGKGNITYVTSMILKSKQEGIISYQITSEEFSKDEQAYWEVVVPEVIIKCKLFYNKALKILDSNVINREFLEPVIEKSFSPIRSLDNELEKIKRILAYYESSSKV